jgi:hypothetical protein
MISNEQEEVRERNRRNEMPNAEGMGDAKSGKY